MLAPMTPVPIQPIRVVPGTIAGNVMLSYLSDAFEMDPQGTDPNIKPRSAKSISIREF